MRITQRQLRQIIKEELGRSIREGSYPYMPSGRMPTTSGTGTIGFSTSVMQDGPYTWQFAISPSWSKIKSALMGAESEGDEGLSSYKLQDLLDNFQISLISVKPGSRLPGGMRAEELPTQLFDMENGYFDVDKTLAALQAAASAQGKT